ncbi:MAG: N-acetylmuramoyl-L-alanine amidase [Lachnospiraceae bacterium]|nr:N-acetylmuramoyl-L-alanine amidase [Lachnospiraceae bacterium]MCM1232725.1 N-acetylmuramoyl-L-alanine amidase [Ruminococcus flavefaciens]
MKSYLATYRLLERNYSSRKGNTISKITIHHCAGNLSINTIYNMFNSTNQEASANYFIDCKGYVYCLVNEEFRAWTSGSFDNDSKAITIECANCSGEPEWEISSHTYQSLINLCADICDRYNITPTFDDTPNSSFTLHYMFQATACPGKFIREHMSQIISDVKEKLNISTETTTNIDLSDIKLYVNDVETNTWVSKLLPAEIICKNGMYALAIQCSRGHFKYRVYTHESGWLPYVDSNDFNLNDEENGYAGIIGQQIVAVEIYYYTPNDVIANDGFYYATYAVQGMNRDNYYDTQYDNIVDDNQDGYAGYLDDYGIEAIKLCLTK